VGETDGLAEIEGCADGLSLANGVGFGDVVGLLLIDGDGVGLLEMVGILDTVGAGVPEGAAVGGTDTVGVLVGLKVGCNAGMQVAFSPAGDLSQHSAVTQLSKESSNS